MYLLHFSVSVCFLAPTLLLIPQSVSVRHPMKQTVGNSMLKRSTSVWNTLVMAESHLTADSFLSVWPFIQVIWSSMWNCQFASCWMGKTRTQLIHSVVSLYSLFCSCVHRCCIDNVDLPMSITFYACWSFVFFDLIFDLSVIIVF